MRQLGMEEGQSPACISVHIRELEEDQKRHQSEPFKILLDRAPARPLLGILIGTFFWRQLGTDQEPINDDWP